MVKNTSSKKNQGVPYSNSSSRFRSTSPSKSTIDANGNVLHYPDSYGVIANIDNPDCINFRQYIRNYNSD